MIWVYIVLAIAAVATTLFEFYVRFLPAWKDNRSRKLVYEKAIKEELSRAINNANDYEYVSFVRYEDGSSSVVITGVDTLKAIIESTIIPKKLCEELIKLKEKLVPQYNQWLVECNRIVGMEIKAQSKTYSDISEAYKTVIDRLNSAWIYKTIYKGDLTFEKAKESVLKNVWDNRDLKDAVESTNFHNLVQECQRLQERESLKALRNAQAAFLQKAQSILQEVSCHKPKLKSG